MDKLKKAGKFIIPASMLLLPFVSLAGLNPLPTPPPGGAAWTLERLKALIENIGNFMIFGGVIIAVIFIIWGGIKYMTAGGDTMKAEEARTAIINGIIGAAIVLGVGTILRTAAAAISGAFFGPGV